MRKEVTVSEAARLRRASKAAVLRWYHAGLVEGRTTEAGQVAIDRESLMKLEKPPRGRPRVEVWRKTGATAGAETFKDWLLSPRRMRGADLRALREHLESIPPHANIHDFHRWTYDRLARYLKQRREHEYVEALGRAWDAWRGYRQKLLDDASITQEEFDELGSGGAPDPDDPDPLA